MKTKLTTILLFCTSLCFAQSKTVKVDFTSLNWKTVGSATVKNFDSKQCTSVSGGVGMAYFDRINFQNGIIECDLYAPANKAYMGIVFRVGSLSNFEYIYFQPHTSGKWDAVQYDPIFNQSATWQLYNGDAYQATAEIPTKEWFHVKIEVKDQNARVYLHDNADPVLLVKLKHELTSGGVGVCSYHPATFANLKITKHAPTNMLIAPPLPDLSDKTYITNWLISAPYNNYSFTTEKPFLKNECARNWRTIQAEENYLINLNRHFSKTNSTNTVLAKVFLNSEKAQKKKLHFGFSDKTRVYLNSKEVFSGDNSFVDSGSYDDRGYVLDKQETIELSLAKGKNELILEVAEDKFGWGFITQLENLEGIASIDTN